MKCPFCNFKLAEFDVTMEHFIPLYNCKNPNCEESKDLIGTQEVWDSINRHKQALNLANAIITKNAIKKLEQEDNK